MRGYQTMKIPEHQTKKFTVYPEAMGALEKFSAGEYTDRFVFQQSTKQSPKEGSRGREGYPWRRQIHPPPVRCLVLDSSEVYRRRDWGAVGDTEARQGQALLSLPILPFSQQPSPPQPMDTASLTVSSSNFAPIPPPVMPEVRLTSHLTKSTSKSQ